MKQLQAHALLVFNVNFRKHHEGLETLAGLPGIRTCSAGSLRSAFYGGLSRIQSLWELHSVQTVSIFHLLPKKFAQKSKLPMP